MLHELFDLLGLPMRHTGLSLLRGPNTIRVNSFSSEDESGIAGIPPPPQPPKTAGNRSAARTAGGRRGVRWRRKPLPVHCVTLQPSLCDKSDNDVNDTDSGETNKEVNCSLLSKSSLECSDNTDIQVNSTSGMSITSAEPVDETWRGGYATAASRRRMMSACSWGNGVQWNRATGRVGQWVRIYPHTLPNDDQLPIEDVREGVAQVSKLLRASREVAREGGRDARGPRDAARDAAFEAALQSKLDYGQNFEIWLPPF